MKKIYLTLLAIAALSCQFYSCSSDENLYPAPELMPDTHHLEIIGNMGFDITQVKDCGDFYMVEGDIALDKADMPLYTQSDPVTRQYKYNTILDASTVRNIRYKIESGVSDSWKQGIYNAVEAWNKIPGNPVQFNLNNDAHFTIGMDLSHPDDNTIAYAYFPTGGSKPGKELKITRYYENRDHYFKTRVIAHELGHIIGLVHSDWYDHNSTSGALIDGSPSKDPYSLMNAYHTNTGFIFSYWDMYSIRKLWQSLTLAPAISVSSKLPNKDVTVKLQNSLPITDVQWKLEGGAKLVRTVSPTEIVVNFPEYNSEYGIHLLSKSLYYEWIPVSFHLHRTDVFVDPYRITPEGPVMVMVYDKQWTRKEFTWEGPVPTQGLSPWIVGPLNKDFPVRVVSQDAKKIVLEFGYERKEHWGGDLKADYTLSYHYDASTVRSVSITSLLFADPGHI